MTYVESTILNAGIEAVSSLWSIILANFSASLQFTAIEETPTPQKKFLWNNSGSISELNNNFMAGRSQSNYRWPPSQHIDQHSGHFLEIRLFLWQTASSCRRDDTLVEESSKEKVCLLVIISLWLHSTFYSLKMIWLYNLKLFVLRGEPFLVC